MVSNLVADIAVVGLGPRGLGALEALAARGPIAAGPIRIDVFDTFPAPGAGPNFAPGESDLCRLNIPVRDLDIRPPEGGCGSFANWLPEPPDPDSFPARADLGRYLEARYRDLKAQAALSLTRHAIRIDALRRSGDGWMLQGDGAWFGPYGEVLLTLGQPKVKPDDQLAEWQEHAQQSAGVLASAYPARDLQAKAADWSGQVVGIRGMALSAFDVLRVLTVGQGGRFTEDGYVPSGREPALILPFSLDGRAPYAKPETEELDAGFAPTDAETAAFLDQMSDAATAPPDQAKALIGAALVPVVARIQAALGTGDTREDVKAWLEAEWEDPASQDEGTPHEYLHAGIEMAEGRRLPSIGYTVGQVWRKWQDEVRSGYNPATTPPETGKLLVGFDEGLKRYSYGPPVSSSRELRALLKAGIVDLAVCEGPDIETVDEGWRLSADGRSETASVMIDAVLPSPDLSIVTAPLVCSLVSDGMLRAVSDGMGADTRADGSVIGENGTAEETLCFLGRLALGSVIAADSLHDCFGEASHRWAAGAVERVSDSR